MASFSTIGDLSASAAQSFSKTNPFEGLTSGFAQGQQQGAQQANSLLQRNLEMKRLQVDSDFKANELDQRKAQLRMDNLQKIGKEEDPVMAKQMAEAHKAMSQKFGWNDDALVDTLTKSQDARQKFLSGLSGIDMTKPENIQMANAKLNAIGGDPFKNSQLINEMAKIPEQQAQTKAHNAAMIAAINARGDVKEKGDVAKNAIDYATPEELTAMFDPNKPPEERVQAMNSAAARAAQVRQAKDQSVITKNSATGTKVSDKRNDDAIKDVEKSKAFAGLEESRTWLDKASGNLHPGGMSRLELKEALLGAGKAFSGAARAGQSLASDAELKTAVKSLTKAAGYFSGDPGEPVSEEEYQNVQKVFDQARAATDKAMKKYAQTSLYSKFGQKKLDREIGAGWYKGRFGEELPPPPWEKSAGGAGGQPQGNGNSFNIKGQQYTKDELKASAAKNGEAGKAWYKQLTGEDF